MKEYIIDTEFVSTQKDVLHYLEIAMLNYESKEIFDFHFNVKLNNRDKSYIKRASSGKYGIRTQQVFKSVEKLYSGSFRIGQARNLCQKLGYKYYYERLEHISKVDLLDEDCVLYAWDTSSDKKVVDEFEHDKITFIDVQNMWIRKFGGNQLSLTNAYKHVLYNLNLKDFQNLIDSAHYACIDVLMLNVVIDFIKTFEGELRPIPILSYERNKKIEDNLELINSWNTNLTNLISHLEIETNPDIIKNIAEKRISISKKIKRKEIENKKLASYPVYERPWWNH